jgi:hypothetical protein
VKFTRPDLAALIVLGVVVVAIAACAIARVDVPAILTEVGLIVAGIAGGAAIPTGTAAALPVEVPAPAPAPAPLPYAAAPGPWATDPAQTGAIPRVATHS